MPNKPFANPATRSFLLGTLVGILTIGLILYINRKVANPYYQVSIPRFVVDSSKVRISLQDDITAIKTQTLTTETKIVSLGKRLDDILIFGGIIVTLLLAISVASYLNVDRQIANHLKDNFDKHKEVIEKYVSDVQIMAGQAKAELDLIKTVRTTVQNNVNPPT